MWISFSSQQLYLKPNQVDIWFVDKKKHLNKLSEYWTVLCDDERKKASQFRFVKDFNCSVIARGVLRTLLGKYLNTNPKNIEFEFGEFGKPQLKETNRLEFNVSHAEDGIAIAFTQKNKIGVDVEYIKRPIEVATIAKQFFSENEVSSLFSVEKSNQQQAFYNCWTRKEAFIKALGDGLSFPLDQFSVSLTSTKEASLLETKWDKKEKENWFLKSFEPKKGYIGAFSVKGKVTDIQFWKY